MELKRMRHDGMLWPCVLLVVSAAAVQTQVQRIDAVHVLSEVLGRPFPPAGVLLARNYSRHCADHVLLYHSQLADLQPWALNMFDASAKMPAGVITGSITNLGHYEQCARIAVQDKVAFAGQLCTATVRFSLLDSSQQQQQLTNRTPDMLGLLKAVAQAAGQKDLSGLAGVSYKWSFCLPSTCSSEDTRHFLDQSLAPLQLPGRLQVSVEVPVNDCLTSRSSQHQLSDLDYYFLSIVSIFVLLVAMATAYDLYFVTQEDTKNHLTKLQMAVLAFSANKNGRALLSTEASKDTMTCLNGIRFLSICWIIFGHTYYQTSISPLINALDVSHFRNKLAMMVVMNGTVSTDTFFVLSGTLLSYVFLRERSKGISLNFARFYLHRYIRLTPPYAVVVLFYASMMYHVSTGPLWDSVMSVERDNCLVSWWTNLLYVNNYVNIANTCMSQSWYLTVDMQLFWLTPLCLYPMWRWRRVGLMVLSCLLAVSVLVPLAVTARYHLTGAMLYTTGDSVTDVFLKIYVPAYTRMGPYFVGIALGYILYSTKGTEVIIPKWAVWLAWVATLSTMVAVVFGVFHMYQQEHQYDVVEASVYAGLHRTIWALCVSWAIFACVSGYGGPADAILSWGVWQPLSRLTYCSYLTHFIFLLVNTATTRTQAFTSPYYVLREMLGIMPLVLLTATALTLVFEMPFVTLDKIFLTSTSGQSPNHDTRPGTSTESPDTLEARRSGDSGAAPQAAHKTAASRRERS